MGLGKVINVHSHSKQAMVWNRATIVCILLLVEGNLSVEGERELIYLRQFKVIGWQLMTIHVE
jgi:hypothetical protein